MDKKMLIIKRLNLAMDKEAVLKIKADFGSSVPV